MIPFLDLGAATAELRTEIDAAISRVVASGRYLLGEETEAFEAEFAAFAGQAHGVSVGSGYDAIEFALRAAGVAPGDEVIVPSHTFVATWLAVRAVGAVPVPVEPVTPWSGIAAAEVASAVTPRTTAVLPVHMHGHVADVRGIREVADRHGLVVIEDAAQAHGATVDGQPIGRWAHATTYSFYPAKNLGALGDGGVVLTDDEALAHRIRSLRNYGSPEKYRHDVFGRNSRLDELQAAVLRVKLTRLADWNGRRQGIAALYARRLAELQDRGWARLPADNARTESSWHLYSILVDGRDTVAADLRRRGVQTGIHYPVPVHLTPAFAELGMARGSLPVAERIADTILSLPIGPQLSEADAERVARTLVEVSAS